MKRQIITMVIEAESEDINEIRSGIIERASQCLVSLEVVDVKPIIELSIAEINYIDTDIVATRELYKRILNSVYGKIKVNSEKIKVTRAEIIVSGSIIKPYYKIKYRKVGCCDDNIGYSSYNLDYVKKWLEENFEIV